MMARRCDLSKLEDWRERLSRFDELQISVVRFCRQEGVSVPTFYYWKKRVAENEADEAIFKPVVVAAERSDEAVTVRLHNGIVEIPASQSDLVLAVVDQLSSDVGDNSDSASCRSEFR